MAEEYRVEIPKRGGGFLPLTLSMGHSIIIVGANGAGKTRLGVFLEAQLSGIPSHRISAQKSLAFSDSISIISLDRAENMLRFGNDQGTEAHKQGHRWGNKPATHELSDIQALLLRLFSEHSRTATLFLEQARKDRGTPVPQTKLQELKAIWDRLLPHRKLKLLEASVEVLPQEFPPNPSPTPSPTNETPKELPSYPASEMSDGERVIFYFLGQSLVAPPNAVLIIDEPEDHTHKAVLGLLWNAIESARPDCCFVYITQDLDFAVRQTTSNKYFVRAYAKDPQAWDIDKIPDNTGLPEQVVAELLGSRKPTLFVEGDLGSLDLTLYNHQYQSFTVVPIGSCDAVVHSVASYRRSKELHWLNVRGLIDADDRSPDDVSHLKSKDVYVLPVAEVENLLLLPSVFLALAESLSCADPKARLAMLHDQVAKLAGTNLDQVSANYTIRQLDRLLKRVEVAAKDLSTLQASYQAEIGSIDAGKIFSGFRAKLEQSIKAGDLAATLKLYDNKGLLALAASILGIKGPSVLMEKVGRLLGSEAGKNLTEELSRVLPSIPA